MGASGVPGARDCCSVATVEVVGIEGSAICRYGVVVDLFAREESQSLGRLHGMPTLLGRRIAIYLANPWV